MGSEVIKVIHNGEVSYFMGFETTPSGQSGDGGKSYTGNYEITLFLDADHDGVSDSADICPGYDDNVDSDEDGVPDGCDACPVDAQNDADTDGLCGDVDNCPNAENPDQFDTDADGQGDVCDSDDDGDGIPDDVDNCPLVVNPGQEDWDNDGRGNVCDQDVDGDGILDDYDRCLEPAPGEPVNAHGCSVAQLCPCEQPWIDHRTYVSCVRGKAKALVKAGVITTKEKRKRSEGSSSFPQALA